MQTPLITTAAQVEEIREMITSALLCSLVPELNGRTKDELCLNFIARRIAPHTVSGFKINFTHAYRYEQTHKMMLNAKLSGAPFAFLSTAYSHAPKR